MVLDALSWHADLVMSGTVNSDLLPQIYSLQEVATGELWLQLKQFAYDEEHGFCV